MLVTFDFSGDWLIAVPACQALPFRLHRCARLVSCDTITCSSAQIGIVSLFSYAHAYSTVYSIAFAVHRDSLWSMMHLVYDLRLLWVAYPPSISLSISAAISTVH